MKKAVEQLEKKLEKYKKTYPEQLSLFYNLPVEDKKYSRLIELYDSIPKYFWGKLNRKEGRFLEDIERYFEHRGIGYRVHISPARIKVKNGVSKEHFPGKREELVEDALRKLACDGQGVFLDDEAGVVFSLYELHHELKRMGHTYSIDELKDALLICAKTTIEVRSGDNKSVVTSNVFETVGLQTRDDWKEHGQKTRAFVRFNLLVTRGIKNKTFRQVNYEKCMAYKNVLSRWLHKRLSYNYTQASPINPYTIKLTTIIRDSGAKRYEKLSNNLREVKKALEEMKEQQILHKYEIEKVHEEGKRRLQDVKIKHFPHIDFIREMKFSNKKYKELHGGGEIQSALSLPGRQKYRSDSTKYRGLTPRSKKLSKKYRGLIPQRLKNIEV